MAEPRSIRARREPLPTGTAVTDSRAFLPEELLSEQVQRLALFCLIAAAPVVGRVHDGPAASCRTPPGCPGTGAR